MVLGLVNKHLHTISKINLVPRTVGGIGNATCLLFILGDKILSGPAIVIIILCLAWPLIAVATSTIRAKRSDEILIMHGDAIGACTCALIAPNLYFIFSHILFLSANGMFTGSYPLMLSLCLTYCLTFAIGAIATDLSFITIDTNARLAIFTYLLVYFGLFTNLVYILTRDFFNVSKKVKKLSFTDALTDCFNRSYLDEALEKALIKAMKTNQQFSVAFTDIDHFKHINDTYGHLAGDKVLKMVAKALRQSLSSEHWVARFGGEEFLIVMPGTTLAKATEIAETLRRAVEDLRVPVENNTLAVTTSFGITDFKPERNSSLLFQSNNEIRCNQQVVKYKDALLTRADKALYRAKESGRNRIEIG